MREIVWGILALSIGAAFAVWSYSRLLVRVPVGWRYVLGSLRALGVAALFFLLAEPFLNRIIEREEKPLIVLLADHSESVFWGKSLLPEEYRREIEKLASALESRGFETVRYAVDRGPRPWDSLNGRAQASQLTRGIDELLGMQPRTAAIVLFSDGREYGETKPLPSGIPIWTVAVGPSAPPSDPSIEAIELPPSLTEKQPVPIAIRFREVKSPCQVEISYPGGQQRISLLSGTQRLPLTLPPLPIGTHILRVRIEAPTDPNPANNQRSAVVEVLPEKVQIFLWAGEITPDIAFMRARLERVGTVQLIAARKPAGYTIAPDTLRWKPTDLHILYNFPARAEDEPWAERLFRENAFVLVSWGAVAPYERFLQAAGWAKAGLLRPYSIQGGMTLYLHACEVFPTAQPIELGWGRPIGYKFYQGNKLVVSLAGEGWWKLRQLPSAESLWDSVFFSLLEEGKRFQRSRWGFAPLRNPLPLGEVAIWRGSLPPQATFTIGGQVVPIRTRADDLQEVVWLPDSAGIYPYTVSAENKTLITGTLLVEALSEELAMLGRDTLYLRYLARMTGGQALEWEERDRLPDALRAALPSTAFITSQRLSIPFHQWSVWLILILSLFSAEWLLRRYVGLY